MRLRLALAVLVGISSAACAEEGFEIVVPGRPGVPVIVNGVDISYALVEGDFGLGKANHNQPIVYGGRAVEAEPNVGHYYPSLGLKPGYGRMEIEPPADRKLPKPAESYHESWSARSEPLPAQSTPAEPFYPPPVVRAPQGRANPPERRPAREPRPTP
ncbi:hypothetical protein [Bradyrhizobium sp.]|uniref:hypothetical protein n=1 Tax=Bradyrhizobium sp. TaxID=376 RepID=UPI003C69F08B